MRIPFVLILLLSSLASACGGPAGRVDAQASAAATPRQVQTATVDERSLDRVVTVTGTLAAEDQVALAFKVSGRVAEMLVDLGSPVKAGQVLARVQPTDFDLRVRQSEAALAQARVRLGLAPDGDEDTVTPEQTALVRQRRAMLNEARLNRDRMKTFVDRGISPKAALETAEAALEVAEGQYQDGIEEIRNRQGLLAQRRSELDIAQQQLRDTVMRAPFDGAVRERQVTTGEYRAAGTPIMTVVRTRPLRLQVAIPERETHGLRPGLPVRVRVESDAAVHDGTLARIGAAIDEANRTLPVEAVVPNQQNVLRPGQFATADIVVSAGDQALVVPGDAIVTFAGVQKVLTVREGKVREQRIRIGRRQGEHVEVVEGVRRGDIVIRSPGDLVEGAAVQSRGTE